MPEATAQALRGGWLHTGDLGRFDPGGHLTLVDRAKDVVITGGYNVYPREVEDVLLAEPRSPRRRSSGVPDPEWGERVVAYLVASAGPRSTRRRSTHAASARSRRHKRPKEYASWPSCRATRPARCSRSRCASCHTELVPPRRRRWRSVELLDETLRDGQQSLWGMRMQAGMALPVADVLDRTGFSVIDFAGSSFMEVLVKYCREDPWEGLDLLRGAIHRTPMRGGMRGNAAVSFGVTPPRADGPLDAAPQRARHALVLDLRRALRDRQLRPRWRGSPRSTAQRSSGPSSSASPRSTRTSTWRPRRPRSPPCRRSTASSSTTPPGVLDVERLRALVPQIIAAARRQAGGVPLEQPDGHLGPGLRRGRKPGVARPAHRQPRRWPTARRCRRPRASSATSS